ENNLVGPQPEAVGGGVRQRGGFVIGKIQQIGHHDAGRAGVDQVGGVRSGRAAEGRAFIVFAPRDFVFLDLVGGVDQAVDGGIPTKIKIPVGALAAVARDG